MEDFLTMKKITMVVVLAFAFELNPAFAVKNYSSKTGKRTWTGFLRGAPRVRPEGGAASAARLGNRGVDHGRAAPAPSAPLMDVQSRAHSNRIPRR